MKYLSRIKGSFATVIGATDAEAIVPGATMEDVPGWDSNNFIDLVMAIEDEFGIELSTLDATSLTSVEAINRYLERRLADG